MRTLFIFLLAFLMQLRGQEFRLVPAGAGFSAPTDIQHAGDGSGRLFIVQQNGLIRILRDGTASGQPFLDIRNRTRIGSERGLLGMAFPPGFAEKRRFYVNYTDLNGDTIIAQYRMSSSPDVADASTEIVLLKIDQPFSNHNGGQLRFGPDGYLYIGMGDGGSGGDPQNNGQRLNTLLGKMLRIDVESSPGTFQVPPGNPFANRAGARPEIWSFGLRNPWRFTFDRATGDLWIADVGQNAVEEVNFQPASSRGGENYGWNLMEGSQCFQRGCNPQGLVLPVAEYSNPAEGCSVTGGFVYRGRSSPGLRGTYIYGDYCTGRIWGVRRQGNGWSNALLLATNHNITTFGEDESGEMYVADAGTGTIYRIEGTRAPNFSSAGVVNAASFTTGLVAGSLATIFASGVRDESGITYADRVPLPISLDGVSITMNGIAAPIHVLANTNGVEQINFQVPFEIAGQPTVRVIVTRGGVSSAPVEAQVATVQPGVYTSDGTQAVVVHNADFSLVTSTRPLVRGEHAFLYAAGLGPVTNAPATGRAAPSEPLASLTGNVRVTLGGLPANVQFAGLAPAFVGVYQLNFQVPGDARSGTNELIVTVGNTASPAVNVPVR